MVAAGENITETLKREFSEETMNSLEMSEDELKSTKKKVHATFQGGHEVKYTRPFKEVTRYHHDS